MIQGDSSGGVVVGPAVAGREGHGVELGQGLRALSERAGLGTPEGVATLARELFLGLPADELCWKVAGFLGKADGSEGLFLYQDEVVTVDAVTGVMKGMKAVCFRSWLVDERKVVPVVRWVDKTGEAIKGSLSKDQADLILNSDILRRRLPVIRAVHKVRMPWLDEALDERGLRRLRLLGRGYDAATGIFTAGALDFPEDVDFQEAVNYFYGLFRTFSWRDENRDFAIHLAALVTMFARGLYEGKAPMFVYNANIQESGKTTLAWYATWLVHGTKGTKPLLQDQDGKLQETLNSMALMGAPFTIFDNVDWGNTPVKTELLDQWISNDEWDFRRLNTNTMVAPRLAGVTLMTGNNLKLSADLQRRSLMVDLWNPLAGADRILPLDAVLIDGNFFVDPANRMRGLGALWAVLRGWDEAGRPGKAGKLLGTFESWSRVVPAVVWHAGQAAGGRAWDCMAAGTNLEIGDKKSREYRALAESVIGEFGPDEGTGVMRERFEVKVTQIAGVARRRCVATMALWPHVDVESVMSTEGDKRDGWKFEGAVSGPGAGFMEDAVDVDEVARMRSASEWLNPKTRSSFGKALDGHLNDRFFLGPDGFYYHVLKLEGRSPATYAVERRKAKA